MVGMAMRAWRWVQQHIVDKTTLEINDILDWEHAGFYPPEFEGAFYLGPGLLRA